MISDAQFALAVQEVARLRMSIVFAKQELGLEVVTVGTEITSFRMIFAGQERAETALVKSALACAAEHDRMTRPKL